ncbi:MAG: DNA repair protein RecN [Lachnospiraceae bacterium]|nr:DNA repair protein RecN [Lachnospiraceae bacterium]
MLQLLHIKNLALIREEEITFSEGLNILTGETGAGKSVIIGSVNLALGARADADMIRSGEETALIELTFVLDAQQETRIEELGFSAEEDHTLLITRRISPGKSVCRVNGETVSLSVLRELADILITIHGQNDHQALLSPAGQKRILDDYCGKKLEKPLERLHELLGRAHEIREILNALNLDDNARIREMDLLRYEIDEIENARLSPDEEETLEKEYRRMTGAEKSVRALGNAYALLAGGDSGENSLSDALGHAQREVAQAGADDEELTALAAQMDELSQLLQDLTRSIQDAEENLVFDEEDLRRTEERLDFLHRLESKYGDSVDRILAAGQEKQKRLVFLEDAARSREEALSEKKKLAEEVAHVCGEITEIRTAAAGELSEKIRASLVDCNFLEVRFSIQVEKDPDAIQSDGWDTVRFDVQTNPGEAMRPLAQIASGGELSRIMLGIKTVLADRNDTPTLVFDEIDAGISGKTAWRVSEKLGTLAAEHQVLCITHLPQIAAMADHHFLIDKETEDERTVTRIRGIDDKESLEELARLLSGDMVTPEVLGNAAQLKEQAGTFKEALKK